MQLSSDPFSTNRRDGLKHISRSVKEVFLRREQCTYECLCFEIDATNTNTMRRRVYDVLSVMRALNIVTKNKRTYTLNQPSGREEAIERKQEEVERLKDMKRVLQYIIEKNTNKKNTNVERLYLPFMILITDTNAEMTCETNEEQSYFKIRCNKKMEIIEDLDVLKEIYKIDEKNKLNIGNGGIGSFDEDINDIYDFIV
ncbi:Transcription factor dpl-1 [Astathelohania contejeani]|uniref:Transcription factor dpl-1 n=1 Tax=Astathelohania contejeani TaxID=164912 RepID=A0ABQ7I1L2_9MICR|nr:Transcription factor dpl-1 [Thelohania contejeani]